MRCKNCGSENEENLYICQNCGSPLYDEEPIEETQDEMGKTKVVPVVTTPNGTTPSPKSPNPNNDDKLAQKKKNQTTIIIVVLAVVLAIVIGVLAGVIIHNSKAEETTSTTLPSTSQTTTQKPVTSSTTTTEPPTTTTTTQPTTTTTTTQVQQYMVEVSCSSGGTVIGRGMYEVNESCVVVATPDPGFVLDGWYINGKRVSSKPSYKFVVKADTNLEAVFTELISEEKE